MNWYQRPNTSHIPRKLGKSEQVLDFLCQHKMLLATEYNVPPLTIVVQKHQYAISRIKLAQKLNVTLNSLRKSINILKKYNLIFTQDIKSGGKTLSTLFTVNIENEKEHIGTSNFVLKIEKVKEKRNTLGHKKEHIRAKKRNTLGQDKKCTNKNEKQEFISQVINKQKNAQNKQEKTQFGVVNETPIVDKSTSLFLNKILDQNNTKGTHKDKKKEHIILNKTLYLKKNITASDSTETPKMLKQETNNFLIYKNLKFSEEEFIKEFQDLINEYSKTYPYKIDKKYWLGQFKQKNIAKKYNLKNLLFCRGYYNTKPEALYAKNFNNLINCELNPDAIDRGYSHYTKKTLSSIYDTHEIEKKEQERIQKEEALFYATKKYWDYMLANNEQEALNLLNKAKIKSKASVSMLLKSKRKKTPDLDVKSNFIDQYIQTQIYSMLESDQTHLAKIEEMYL